MNEKFEAFKLLGKTAKYLSESEYKTEETVSGVYGAMAHILRDMKVSELQEVKKDDKDMVALCDKLLKCY